MEALNVFSLVCKQIDRNCLHYPYSILSLKVLRNFLCFENTPAFYILLTILFSLIDFWSRKKTPTYHLCIQDLWFIIRGSCQYLQYFAEILVVLFQIERYLFTKELLSYKINRYSMLMRTLSEDESILSTIALFITAGTD